MKKEKIDSIVSGVSAILDSLGDLAEKGRQLKKTASEAESRATDNGPLQQLNTKLEKTELGLKLAISSHDLTKAKIEVKIQDDVMHIKIVKGEYIECKDVEITPGFRIDSMYLDNDSDCMEIHCS